MFGAGAYGEAEFWFACVIVRSLLFLRTNALASSIKVLTITGLIILGFVLDLGGGPNHDRIGFRYWKDPGPFAQYKGISGAEGRFLGWWSVLDNAAFSFIGTEIVAVSWIFKSSLFVFTFPDCSWRNEEPAAQPSQSNPPRIYSYSPVLYSRHSCDRSTRPV